MKLTGGRASACFQAIYANRGAVDAFGRKPARIFGLGYFSLKSQLPFLGSKMPIYARNGIVEAWLVDIQAQTVSIYQEPGKNGYRLLLTPTRNESITPSLLPNAVIQLTDLWK